MLAGLRRRPGHVRRRAVRRIQRGTGTGRGGNLHALRQRQTSEAFGATASNPSRVNLLNWDGNGVPEGMFPAGNNGHRGADR